MKEDPRQVKEDSRQVKVEVPVLAECTARGEKPEYLFWVGSAGAFDDRYKQVTRAFARILGYLGTSYAVLGGRNHQAEMWHAGRATKCSSRCRP